MPGDEILHVSIPQRASDGKNAIDAVVHHVDGALRGRGLELAWAADPIDMFFLEIQGSGRLKLPDGTIKVTCEYCSRVYAVEPATVEG